MEKFIVYCEENADELDLQGLSQAIAESVQTNTPLAIELLFVDAEEIRLLNKQTRGVDSVTDVLSFDEGAVLLRTEMGLLTVQGRELRLKTLSPEGGLISVEGNVASLVYEESRQMGGWLSRLLG